MYANVLDNMTLSRREHEKCCTEIRSLELPMQVLKWFSLKTARPNIRFKFDFKVYQGNFI